ncbi:MAG: Ribosomal RNA small subunit methyltransferase A [Candidatus Heimdallarchaeota archaeon LC_3]|nr:MAG: Ribosomal RNA small subunit methyltransferase A [Candidatus Heimdallarchaeota archaeon LC_3]
MNEKKTTTLLSNFIKNKDTGVYINPLEDGEIFDYSDGEKIELYLLESIKNSASVEEGSRELMSYIKDWPSFYHLGNGRSNILKALDLPKDSKILELGSGCGAVTRYLGENFKSVDCIEGSYERANIAKERCRDLDNVNIYCSDVQTVELKPEYDYVTIIGVLEYASVFFSDKSDSASFFLLIAKSGLKPNGKLIIAIENKIGLKYWSGCPEDHTGMFYEGIVDYPRHKTPKTFSQNEIKGILKEIDFKEYNFYYCFPDYKFASTIISEKGDEDYYHLHNWISTPFIVYNKEREYNFNESLALRTLSKDKILRQFSNSFLIIASTESFKNPPAEWILKHYSLNRQHDLQCITKLVEGTENIVSKQRIFDKKNEARSIKLLFDEGEFTLKHQISDSKWIKGDSLIYELYEALYSSDFHQNAKNVLKKWYDALSKEFDTGDKDSQGYPLFKGSSIDLIIRNYIKKSTEELVPIDIEWIVDGNIPADFIVYRCIRIDILQFMNGNIPKPKFYSDMNKTKIEYVQTIFPFYDQKRNANNTKIEDQFQRQVNVSYTANLLKTKSLYKKLIKNKLTSSLGKKMPSFVKKTVRKL